MPARAVLPSPSDVGLHVDAAALEPTDADGGGVGGSERDLEAWRAAVRGSIQQTPTVGRRRE